MERWQEQEAKLKEEEEQRKVVEKEQEVHNFDVVAHGLLPQSASQNKKREAPRKDAEPVKKMKLASYWVPGVREELKGNELLKKPSQDTMCPEGNHPIKLKQLVALKFSENTNKGKALDPNKSPSSYQCFVCYKTLNNAVKAGALQKCGHVMCIPCLDTLKKDKTCTCGKEFKEKHILKLETGGTAYAESSGEKLKPTVITPAFMG